MMISVVKHSTIIFLDYLTANSCSHPGYREYNWPSGWRTDVMGADECENVSSDGSGTVFYGATMLEWTSLNNEVLLAGVPEQFW